MQDLAGRQVRPHRRVGRGGRAERPDAPVARSQDPAVGVHGPQGSSTTGSGAPASGADAAPPAVAGVVQVRGSYLRAATGPPGRSSGLLRESGRGTGGSQGLRVVGSAQEPARSLRAVALDTVDRPAGDSEGRTHQVDGRRSSGSVAGHHPSVRSSQGCLTDGPRRCDPRGKLGADGRRLERATRPDVAPVTCEGRRGSVVLGAVASRWFRGPGRDAAPTMWWFRVRPTIIGSSHAHRHPDRRR